MQFADVNGLEGDMESLIKMPEVKHGVLKQLERAADLNKLDEVEFIRAVSITLEAFSQNNGLLTNTMKMRRL